MRRTLTAAVLAVALAPGLGCLQYNDQCRPLVADPDAIVGYLGEDVFLDKPYARHDNQAIGQLAADAFLHAEDDSKAPAELGIINGGALRAEGLCVTRTLLPQGPLKNGLLHEILLFENAVVTVDLTEKQLVDMFEHSVEGLAPQGQPIVSPSGAFLHVSEGTVLTLDCERPPGQRVVGLTVKGRTVPVSSPRTDLSVRYRVAMPDFLLQGGDGYGTIFKDAATDLSRNPVTASTAEGKATDANLTEAYMRANHSSESQALREEAGRIVLTHCARPGRPVVR